ncbi:MAG: CHAP domain-containing protein [Parahaliea sp.]
MKRVALVLALFLLIATSAATAYFFLAKDGNPNSAHQIGDVLDSLHGVEVYYNGRVGHVSERHLAPDGYNIGLKYQCVEFVKRYYYQHLKHKMPDSYGHAKDFFDKRLPSGTLNQQRNLIQYSNGSGRLPAVGDLLVYSSTIVNPYGHVAIVSAVNHADAQVEIIQQNPGPFAASRERYGLQQQTDGWLIENDRILGWLHKAD